MLLVLLELNFDYDKVLNKYCKLMFLNFVK